MPRNEALQAKLFTTSRTARSGASSETGIAKFVSGKYHFDKTLRGQVEVSRKTTAYIKGAAVAAILFVHYVQYYFTGIYEWEQGFAFALVSLFFVFSGLGNFFSLERRLERGSSAVRAIVRFYLDRAAAIYPFFWIAAFFMPFFYREYGVLHETGFSTAAIYLGLPFVQPPGIFWFVVAILQCYLAAPLIYLVLIRVRPAAFLRVIFFLVNLVLLITVFVLFLDRAGLAANPIKTLFTFRGAFTYRYFFLSNIALFSLGMVVPPLIRLYKEQLSRPVFFYASAALFLLSAYLTRNPDELFPLSGWYLTPLLVISIFCLCLFAVAAPLRLPVQKFFSHVGGHVYPFYLFHMLFFALLATAGIVKDNSLVSFLLMVLLLPAFYLFCLLMDKGQKTLVGGLMANSNREKIHRLESLTSELPD